jgi:putative acetyltransferase
MISTLQFITREESAADREAVFAIHAAAFDTDAEAVLVDAVRDSSNPIVSLVAVAGEERIDGLVIGHILVSPVRIDNAPEDILYMALGPMAVHPDYQRRGVGARLVLNALEACRAIDAAAVFVLGHPDYYPRLGFEHVSSLGLYYKDESYAPAFFAIENKANALTDRAGLVHYHPAFDEL